MATNIPSHNVAEIIDAAMLLVEQPEASHEQIMALVQGPDFATGGIVIDSPAAIQDAYATGRGAFRVRSRWHKEDEGRGTWVRSEEHTSELQSLMRISYAVFCLQKKQPLKH